MKTAIVMTLGLALLVLAGARTTQADDFEKHIKKYHEHVNKAYEDLAKGDVKGFHKELGKAQTEYNAAFWKTEPPASCGSSKEPAVCGQRDHEPVPLGMYAAK